VGYSSPVIQLNIGHGSPFAILISTMAVAGLFNPLRSRIQSLIGRRFFRSKYNLEQALVRFQQGLSRPVHLAEVESNLIDIVQSTLQPAMVGLWIRKEEWEGDKRGQIL
jgi:hypothetical protein